MPVTVRPEKSWGQRRRPALRVVYLSIGSSVVGGNRTRTWPPERAQRVLQRATEHGFAVSLSEQRRRHAESPALRRFPVWPRRCPAAAAFDLSPGTASTTCESAPACPRAAR